MFKRSILPFVSLFTSAGTLICCALPALFVTLGLGASFAGLLGRFPQLIWFSEHKPLVFGGAGIALALAGVSQWYARNLPCPIDPQAADACKKTRRASLITYGVSVLIYLIGVGFAFIPPLFEK